MKGWNESGFVIERTLDFGSNWGGGGVIIHLPFFFWTPYDSYECEGP
jgi:hypothetical protein